MSNLTRRNRRAVQRKQAKVAGKQATMLRGAVKAVKDREVQTWIGADGKVLTREQVERTVETAKRLHEKGFVIADRMELWTPEQG